jgi:hypothetical protein
MHLSHTYFGAWAERRQILFDYPPKWSYIRTSFSGDKLFRDKRKRRKHSRIVEGLQKNNNKKNEDSQMIINENGHTVVLFLLGFVNRLNSRIVKQSVNAF